MAVGDIGKARQLEWTITKAIEEAGYALVDINRKFDQSKHSIIIRYYDKCEPTWDFTYHTVELPLTREEYINYANAGLDKIVKELKNHIKSTREDLYRKAYPGKYPEKEKV